MGLPSAALPVLRSEGERLVFLDGLRGVAALAVLAQHLGEGPFPAVQSFTTFDVQVGQLGVTVFFLCSGFIIPSSLERHRSLRAFWVSRGFRLYPLYWLSIVGALVLGYLGIFHLPDSFRIRPIQSVVVNLTMLQTFVAVPNALAPYWSLAFEVEFYVIVSGLFVLGRLKNSLATAVTALSLSIVAGVAAPLILGRPGPIGIIFNLATMFFGTVLYRVHTGEIPTRRALRTGALALTAMVAILAANFAGRDDPSAGGTRSFLPMLTAWALAYALFGATVAFRPRYILCPAVYVGRISYSVYLLHPLIIAAVPAIGGPIVTTLIWSSATVAVASITYRFIEVPSIRLGRRLLQNDGQTGDVRARQTRRPWRTGTALHEQAHH